MELIFIAFICCVKMKKRNATSEETAKKKRLMKKGNHSNCISKPKVKQTPLNELKWIEWQRCGAFKLNTESKGFCCGNGKKHVVDLPEVPSIVLEMIRKEKELQHRARAYNNLFSFSAVGTTGLKGFHYHDGFSNLVLHGQSYHWMASGNEIFDLVFG